MRQPRDQHWADLLEAMEIEADKLGGNGEFTIRVKLYQGQPRECHASDSVSVYRLGKSAPPLVGQS